MTKPILHVMFGDSAAGTMRQVLRKTGRDERVVSPGDDFSFGPIGPDSSSRRAVWVDDVMRLDFWEEVVAGSLPFLAASCSPDVYPVAWTSRRSTIDHAGFLWWLSHLGDAPCFIIDVTDVTVPHGRTGEPCPVSGTGVLNDEQMAGLLDKAAPLSDEDRRRYRSLWQKLVTEDAPLRVIDHGELVSAPIDYFDQLLLSLATPEWQKMARIVAYGLVAFIDEDLHQTGDLFLQARLRDLAEAGILEWQGDLSDMRGSELRLPITGKAG